MRDLDLNSQTNNKKRKCCATGLHFTKNDVCIQSIRPFKTRSLNNKEAPEFQSEFCRSILESRIEPDVSEFEEMCKVDIEDVLNDFASTFNMKGD